jgi:UrcA family protein
MKTILTRFALGAVSSGLVGGVTVAQSMEEITVQGTRTVTTQTVGRSSLGMPINAVTLTYRVGTAGLDLGSPAGLAQAEKRVKDVAETACRELGRLYPDSTPSDAECAKAAADKAVARLKELAAARKASIK